MTRSRTIGTAVVVCALLVAALVWFVQFDGPRAERSEASASPERTSAPTQLAASELAPTPTTLDARSATLPLVVANATDASSTSAEAPHLVITRADAPLVGAHVELWSEPRDGEAQSFAFTSDADGRVPLPADMQGHGPWFALAGGDGACSSKFAPVTVDPLAATTKIECVDMQHVAVVFERSDGQPTGTWLGYFSNLAVRIDDAARILLRLSFTPAEARCLVGAGLVSSHVDAHWEVSILTWGHTSPAESTSVTGTFEEPDTEFVEWSATTVPLARGGALERVPIPVVDDFASGFVEVRFGGAEAATVLEFSEQVSVHLRPEGKRGFVDDVNLYVRKPGAPPALQQTLFRVQVGRYDARLQLSVNLGAGLILVRDVDVVRDATTEIDFELPPTAVLVLDGASRAALLRDQPEVIVQLVDVDTGESQSSSLDFGDRLSTLVPAGRWVAHVRGRTSGVFVPSGRARDLTSDSAKHAEVFRLLGESGGGAADIPLSAILRELFIDARAGSAIRVEFVPDPLREEER